MLQEPYTLVSLLRPAASQEEIDYVVELVNQLVRESEGEVYKQEKEDRDLCYEIRGHTSATALIVCWTGPKSLVEKIRNKIRYEARVIRYEIFRDKDKNDASRLKEAPLKSSLSLFCTNPGLSQYLSENGRILPRKFTGLKAKAQRKMSREVKSARKLGLLKL